MTPAAPATEVILRPPATRWGSADALLLVGLIIVAVGVRLLSMDATLSFDELWHISSTLGIGNALEFYPQNTLIHDAINLTSMQHARPFWQVWTGIDGILHPPLFLMALRFWRDLFGSSDLTGHLFSITWSVVAVACCFDSARLTMNRTAATLAALCVALSGTQIYFAQEVRGYQMLVSIGSIALWLMTRVEVLGVTRRRAFGLALVTLPIQLTHYFGFGGALAVGLYGLLRCGPHRRSFLAGIGVSALMFGLLWVPFALRQIDDLGTGDAFLHWPNNKIHTLLLAVGTPFRLIAERDYQLELTPTFSGALFFLPWMLVRRFRPLLPWVLWLCACIGPILALDWARETVHTAYPRYLAIASPAVPLLFIGTAWAVRRWLAYVVGSGICAAGFVYWLSNNIIPLDSDNFSPVVAVLEKRFEPGDVIVTYPGNAPLYFAEALLLEVSHADRLSPKDLVRMRQPMTPELAGQLAGRTVWLISGPLDRPPEQIVPGARVLEMIGADRSLLVTKLRLPSPASPATVPATPAT
jgi:Dolichyl-phosphate-mannose-protein mannosyltransferase